MASHWQIILPFYLWIYRQRVSPKNKCAKEQEYQVFDVSWEVTLNFAAYARGSLPAFIWQSSKWHSGLFFFTWDEESSQEKLKGSNKFLKYPEWPNQTVQHRSHVTAPVLQITGIKKLCMVIMVYINSSVSNAIWSIVFIQNYLSSLGIYRSVSQFRLCSALPELGQHALFWYSGELMLKTASRTAGFENLPWSLMLHSRQ